MGKAILQLENILRECFENMFGLHYHGVIFRQDRMWYVSILPVVERYLSVWTCVLIYSPNILKSDLKQFLGIKGTEHYW